MKSFSQFLNEAYSTEMKSVFTKEQLSKLGKFFNERYNISVQDSNFKHYTPKTFKVKFGAENGIAICRLLDKSYVILEIENQRTYRISKVEDNGRYFSTSKEVLSQSTDIFVFENVSKNKYLKDTRRQNSRLTDKLARKEYSLNTRKKLQNDYIISVNNQLKKYKMSFTLLCFIEYNEEKDRYLKFEFDNKNNVFNSLSTVYVHSKSYKEEELEVEITCSSFRSDKISEVDKFIKSIEESKEALNIIKSIDLNKIPVFTLEEYNSIIKK